MTEILNYHCTDCDDRCCFVEFVDSADVMSCPNGYSSFWHFIVRTDVITVRYSVYGVTYENQKVNE